MDFKQEESVKSLLPSKQILIKSSGLLDDRFNIIRELNLGNNYKEAIVNDVESFLYEQDPGSELFSITCVDNPHYFGKAGEKNEKVDVSKFIKIMFHFDLMVIASSKEKWTLSIYFSYEKTPSHGSGAFKLKRDFIIIKAEKF